MYFVKKNTVLCRKKITFFCYKIYNIWIGIDNKNYNAIKNKYIACKEKKNKKTQKKASLLLTGMSVQEVSHFGDVSLGSIKNGGSAIMEVLHSK